MCLSRIPPQVPAQSDVLLAAATCCEELFTATQPPPGECGMREGPDRKELRTSAEFLVRIFEVRHPLLTQLAMVENLSSGGARLSTERSLELGSQVCVESIAPELKAKAQVVYCYCKALGPKKFAVGLKILVHDNGGAKPSTK